MKITIMMLNRGADASVSCSVPVERTRDEVMKAVAEWYDAIGTHTSANFDVIQFIHVKENGNT